MLNPEFILRYVAGLLIFYIVGRLIAWLWLPLRLLFILPLSYGVFEIIERIIFANSNERPFNTIFLTIVPLLLMIYPSIKKTFGFEFSFPSTAIIDGFFDVIRRSNYERRQKRENAQASTSRADQTEQDEVWSTRQRQKWQEEQTRRYDEEMRLEDERRRQAEQKRREDARREAEERRAREEAERRRKAQENEQQKPPPKADAYEVLGVTRDMCLDEIRRIFIDLSKIYHPDTGRSKNEAKYKEISNAYDVIKKEKGNR